MDNISLHFEACGIHGENIWISEKEYNALYKMNVVTGSITYCGEFPFEPSLKKRLHYGNTIIIDNKIYFIPLESSYIHIYNLDSEKIESYKIADCAAGLCAGYMYNNFIYMISTRNRDIIRYDVQKNMAKKVYQEKDCDSVGYAHGSFLYDNYLYMVVRNSHILRQFDLKKQRMYEWDLSDMRENFELVGVYKGLIYLKGKNSNMLYTWNMERHSIICQNIIFMHSLNSWQNNELILANNDKDNYVHIYNILDNKVIREKIENLQMDTDPFIISTAVSYKNDILFVNKQDNCLYSVLRGKKKYSLQIDENEIRKKKRDIQNNNLEIRDVLKEAYIFEIEGFINKVARV